eukprot:TRINITY_DN15505_c1_g1_i1.p1 TRINITY_DN15505_c1_g1~~TRINITY_DN15505_c1_g1_i1.p1  ORF type:complete len:1076 (+),score=210.60 TRINITY_DN15505_c1_g1_i1:900-4127(+)
MLTFKNTLSIDKSSKRIPSIHHRSMLQYVIGVEKEGIVLVARYDYDSSGVYRSYIDLYDMANGNNEGRQIRFKQSSESVEKDGALRFLSASVSKDKTFLACTVQKDSKRNDSADHDNLGEYECWIMGRGQRCYVLKAKDQKGGLSQQMIRVQFLHLDKAPKPFYLYMVDKEKIELYSLQQSDRKKEITGQSERAYVVAEQHLWSQFLPYNNTLFILFMNQKKGSKNERSASGIYDCTLKCFGFKGPGRRSDLLFEVNLSMRLSNQVFTQPTVYRQQCWANGSASPDKHLRLQIVSLTEKKDRSRVLVLVQQHTVSDDVTMRLTMYCLVTKHVINLSITPDPSLPPLPPGTSVFVGPLKRRMLVVYLPGYFAYLVDVQHRTRPTRLLLGATESLMTVSPQEQLQGVNGEQLTVHALAKLEQPGVGKKTNEADLRKMHHSGNGNYHQSFDTVGRTSTNCSPVVEGEGLQTSVIENSSPTSSGPLDGGSPPVNGGQVAAPPTSNSQVPAVPAAPAVPAPTVAAAPPLLGCVVTSQGPHLIDFRTCSFYSYDLNETVLKTWMLTHAPPDALPPLMHFLLAHMPDMSSIGFTPIGVLKGLATNSPNCITPELFKEYLLGASHAKLKDVYRGDAEGQELLDLVPRTTLTSTPGNQHRQYSEGCRLTVTRFPGIVPSVDRVLQLPVPICCDVGVESPSGSQGGRASYAKSTGGHTDMASSSGGGGSSGFFSVLKERLNSFTSYQVPKQLGNRNDKSFSEIQYDMLCDNLTDQMIKGGARTEVKAGGYENITPQLWPAVPRAKAASFVDNYIREGITRTVDQLIRELLSCLDLETRSLDAYNVLFALTTALEDLSFPRPTTLNTQFTCAAFRSRSRRSFLQLVNRGAIILTRELIDDLRREASLDKKSKYTPKQDKDYFLQLVLSLPTMQQRIDIVEVDGTCEDFLLQYHQSMIKEGNSNQNPGNRNSNSMFGNTVTEEDEPITNFVPFETLRPGWEAAADSHARLYLEAHAADWIAQALSPLVIVRDSNREPSPGILSGGFTETTFESFSPSPDRESSIMTRRTVSQAPSNGRHPSLPAYGM